MASSIILWNWTVVFKPIIPNWCYACKVDSHKYFIPYDEDRRNQWTSHSGFVKIFTDYCFYEQKDVCYERWTWSTVSLLVQFSVSVIVMNCSFAVYYNNETYHNTMIGLGIGSALLASLLQTLIFISYWKGRNTLDKPLIKDAKVMFKWWIGIIITWQVVSIGLLFVHLPYGGVWKIDPAFQETSMARNIFFIVQGIPGLIGALIGAIYLLFLLGKGLRICCGCCCNRMTQQIGETKENISQMKNEVSRTRERIEQQKRDRDNEMNKIDDIIIDGYV